jgi:hypothetical protein
VATAESAPPQLSEEELADMFKLVEGADSVELKLTVPDEHHRSTVVALGMDPLDAELRQIFFFDTPDLRLNQAGLVVRARRIQRKGDDSVVKLRPVVPSDLSKDVRSSPNMVVEVDAMPGGYVCSASMKNALGANDAVKKVAGGKRPHRKLFSKEQRAFYEAHAPEGIALDDLALLGPILVLKLRFKPADYKQKIVAELWNYPDSSRILELSTKCAPADTQRVSDEARAFLTGRGVDLSGEQQTKTKTALDFFSQGLVAPAP